MLSTLRYVAMSINVYVEVQSEKFYELSQWYTRGINKEEYNIVDSKEKASLMIRFSDPIDLTVVEGCPVLLYVSCPLGHKESIRFDRNWSMDDLETLREQNKIIPFGSSMYHTAPLENVKVIYPKMEPVVSKSLAPKTFYFFIGKESIDTGMREGRKRPKMVSWDNDNLSALLQAFCSLCLLDSGVKLIISSDSDDLEKYISRVVKTLIKNNLITKAMWKNFASGYMTLTSPDVDSHSELLAGQVGYLLAPSLGNDVTPELLYAIKMGVPVLMPESLISKELREIFGQGTIEQIPSMSVKNRMTDEPYILVENWSFINYLLKVLMGCTSRHALRNVPPLKEIHDINNYLYYVHKMCTVSM